jgi:hypothetical protein
VLLTITGVQVLAFVHDVAGNHAAGWQPCCWLAPMLLAGTHSVAGVLASRFCSMMSLLLLILVLPMPEKYSGL